MCELLALSFERPISAGFSLREFGPRGEENPDGWGLAWYPDRSLSMIKEPLKWSSSPKARFFEQEPSISGRICLAHVRHKTMGGAPSHADTHPFARELGGRDYGFAHNGTLDGPAWDLPLGRFHPIGETDSERFFCHLMDQIGQRNSLDSLDDWQWLHQTLAAANAFGKLNVLMSDGVRLFVYHDVNGWKGLNFRKIRFATDQPRHFDDENLAIDLEGVVANHGFVVATCPLSSGRWDSFRLGELMVFETGSIRYSSHRTKSELP
jgi:predicted glutamine amidotransferase